MDPRPRILHLEDDPDWTDLIKQILGRRYEVVATSSVAAAEELLNTQDFALALVDTSLVPMQGSDITGNQLISYIRASDLVADLPVIVLTGYDWKERMRVAFKDLKVFDFVSKHELEPVDFEVLVAQAVASGPRGRNFGESPRALVIDDDPDWQSLLQQILEDEGCQVETASTYAEAIQRLTSGVYHLATVDIRLDDLDSNDVRGFELTDIVRRLRQSVEFIFISGHGSLAQMRKAAFDHGAKDLIDKGSFESQHLRLRVRRILRYLIYVTVTVGTGSDAPVLKLGEAYPVVVSVSRIRPQKGISRSLARPLTTGRFDLEVVLHPFDVDVLPGSAQSLTVMSDDSAQPATFTIIPTSLGRIELPLDFLSGSKMLTRVLVVGEAVA